MIEIELSRGYVALIDESDLEIVAKHKWFVSIDSTGRAYAARSIRDGKRKTTVLMHRVLLEAQPGQMVDHVDGDGLNNRRSNIRLASPVQNQANRRPLPGQLKGVKRVGRRWRAVIHSRSLPVHLGTFDSDVEAALVYDAAAVEAWGVFAWTNFPDAITRV